jgi:hypothetical protein
MTLTTDSHFVIGHMHLTAGKPCQDYAIAKVQGAGTANCVLSDGCSTGGMTDVGARVVALSMANALQYSWRGQPPELRDKAMLEAKIALDLSSNDLLATSLCIQLHPELGGWIYMEGDGVIAFKNREGLINMTRYEWANNMPYYPIYRQNLDTFLEAHGTDPEGKRMTVEKWKVKACGYCKTWEETDKFELPLKAGLSGILIPIVPTELPYLDLIAIFSDGICQIEGMDWKDAVKELLAFKSTGGEFVKRRMNAFVKNALKLGHKPQDDLSCAVIKVNHDDAQS